MIRLFLAISLLIFSWGVNASYGIRLDSNMRCPAVENQLGQLLYVSVDGFGKNVKGAIHPDYIKLVKLLNIGGVSVKFGKGDIKAMHGATAELLAATDLPLFIGAEFLPINYNGALVTQNNKQGSQRLVAGNKAGKCGGQHDVLDSYLFKAAGLNHKLLASANRKVLLTYKNMEVMGTGLLPIDFGSGSRIDGIVMSSHKVLEDNSMITLSRKFIRGALYNQTLDKEFKGLLISDRINKVAKIRSDYAKFTSDWFERHPNDDPKAVFVANTILAGHHMVYLQGVARDTLKVYQNIAMMACRDDIDAKRLQFAIAKSFHHISEYKKARSGALKYRPRMDEKLIADVLDYKYRLQGNSCSVEDSASFNHLHDRIMLAR